jgi:hemerythrin
MAFFTWSDNLSVNITEIDEQHKKLFNMMNELHSAMGSGKGKESLGGILAGLVDYTKTHLTFEEQLMEKHKYPDYTGHKKMHAALTAQVVEQMKKYQEGKTLVAVEIMNFLKDWLVTHIQNTDKKYVSHFNSKGVV